MKKFIRTFVSTMLIATIVSTATYKVNSPSFNMGTTTQSNQGSSTTTVLR